MLCIVPIVLQKKKKILPVFLKPTMRHAVVVARDLKYIIAITKLFGAFNIIEENSADGRIVVRMQRRIDSGVSLCVLIHHGGNCIIFAITIILHTRARPRRVNKCRKLHMIQPRVPALVITSN